MSECPHTLKTERLILREIRESDAGQIVEWRSNPKVYPFFKSPHALTKEEHLNWYKNSYLKDANRLDWICIETTLGKAMGVFSLRKIAEVPESAEVSYLIAPKEQRKGYAAEAIRTLIRYVAEEWSARIVIAEIHVNNEPSIRLVQKLGFAFMERRGLFVVYCLHLR